MEKLKQSQEIISLGKKLVDEFSYEGRCGMTIRWMSHYLAECISKAESENNPAKKIHLEKECCDTIMNLWNRRKNLPGKVRPLSNLDDTLSVLSALVDERRDIESWERYIDDHHQEGWGKFMKETRKKFSEITALSIWASLGADALANEKKWLSHKNLLSETEKAIIEKLDKLLHSREAYIRIILSPEIIDKEKKKAKTETRLNRVFEKIQDHINNLGHILDSLKKDKKVK